jgi:L-ascorbate metabolism protein UlaG (beta-lactamase superfamily)
MLISIISTGVRCVAWRPTSRSLCRSGVGNLVHDLGFHIVHELDYWQTVELGSAQNFAHALSSLGCTVSCGFAPRLWWIRDCGEWSEPFFTAAIAPTFPALREIGDRYPIEIALLPIGAYEAPTGREVHMNPEEAVKAFLGTRRQDFDPDALRDFSPWLRTAA